jgi:hypothetical protein
LIALLTFASAAAAACPGLAQIDPDPDGVGIYADLTATANHMDEYPGFPFSLYVVLTRPSLASYPGTLCGCGFTLGIPPNVTVGGWEYPDAHWNATVPPDFHLVTVVINAVTLTSTTLLLELQGVMALDGAPAPFYIFPLAVEPGGLFYLSCDPWGTLGETMHPSSGSSGTPVFVLNGDAPVPDRRATWSELKALYR